MASASSIRAATRCGLVILAVVLGLGGMTAGMEGARAQTQGGQMVADCEGATRAVESDCSFGDGQEFTVAVQVPQAPGDGYWGFQSKLRWNNDIIDYQPTQEPPDEAVWPNCSVPARTDNRAGGQDIQVDTSLLFGCVPFPLAVSSYVGPVFLFNFVCAGSGSSDLTLVAREGDSQLGSHFLDVNLSPVDPSFENARVTCGGPEVDRPPPEIVPGNVTPLPEEGTPQEQSTATPGGPTATPGGPTATTGPTTEPTPGGGEEDNNGGGLPVWAWVLIGVGAVAGAGGGGYLLWQRMRQTGGGTPGGATGAGGAPGSGGGGGAASGGDAGAGEAGSGGSEAGTSGAGGSGDG